MKSLFIYVSSCMNILFEPLDLTHLKFYLRKKNHKLGGSLQTYYKSLSQSPLREAPNKQNETILLKFRSRNLHIWMHKSIQFWIWKFPYVNGSAQARPMAVGERHRRRRRRIRHCRRHASPRCCPN